MAFTDRPEIPRRPKKAPATETVSNGQQNGKHEPDGDVESELKGTKRPHPEGEEQPLKKAKLADSAADDVVVVEDAGGAIVIDD